MEDDDEDDNAMFGGWDPGVFKDEIEEEESEEEVKVAVVETDSDSDTDSDLQGVKHEETQTSEGKDDPSEEEFLEDESEPCPELEPESDNDTVSKTGDSGIESAEPSELGASGPSSARAFDDAKILAKDFKKPRPRPPPQRERKM